MDICMDYPQGLIKLPIYDASALVKGQGLKWGVDASNTSTCALIDITDTAADIFAILQETPSSVVTNVGTPVVYQATVRLINNPSIIKAYYDLSTSTDLNVVTAAATGLTGLTCDDNLDGSWVYINSGTGAGQLRYIKAADTASFTVNTNFTTTPDATSDFILIRNVGIPTAGIAFNATFDKILSVLDETSSEKTFILKNFIQGPMGTKELDITLNPDLECDGLNGRSVRFFSLCILHDTALAATGV